jgi:phosphate acetyltransferase
MIDRPNVDEPSGGDKYKRLIAAAQKATRIKVAVAHACDDVSLSGAIEAHKLARYSPGFECAPAGRPGSGR